MKLKIIHLLFLTFFTQFLLCSYLRPVDAGRIARDFTNFTIRAEEIKNLPLNNLTELIVTFPGVVDYYGEIYIHGTNLEEIVFLIDGMEVSNELVLKMDINSIKEIELITGEFNAEYGNFHAAVIHICTKNSNWKFSGNLTGQSDHQLSRENWNSDDLDFTLSGPVLPFLRDRLKFFIDLSGNWNDTQYKKYYNSNPADELKYLVNYWDDYEPYNPYYREENMGFDIEERNYNLHNFFGKLDWKINRRQKLNFSAFLNKEIIHPYEHGWKYALEYYCELENKQNQFNASYNFLISPQMTLGIKGSYYEYNQKSGPQSISKNDYFTQILFSDDETTYWDYAEDVHSVDGIDFLTTTGLYNDENYGQWLFDVDDEIHNMWEFISPGAIYRTHQDNETNIYSFQTDFEYKLNKIHHFKTGFDFRKKKTKNEILENPWQIDEYRFYKYLENETTPYDSVYNSIDDIWIYTYTVEDLYAATLNSAGDRSGYEIEPWQCSFFLQDNFRLGKININAGLRLDHYNLGGKYKILQDNGEYKWEYFEKDLNSEFVAAPRLSFNYEISPESVIYYTFSHQNRLLFTPQNSIPDPFDNPDEIINPYLSDIQRAIVLDIGLYQQIFDDYLLKINKYFIDKKYDRYGLIKVYDPTDETVFWYLVIQLDNPLLEGIDITLEKWLSQFFLGSISYSYNSELQRNYCFHFSFIVHQCELYEIPYSGFILPFDDFSINFLYKLTSGKKYTPLNEYGNPLEELSASQPNIETAKLKIRKNFVLGEKIHIGAFLTIDNLFNKKNILYVYPRTGSPYYDGTDLSDENGYTAAETQYIHDQYTKDPANISEGRTFILGFEFNW